MIFYWMITAGYCTDYLDVLIGEGRLSLETTLVSFDPVDVTDSSTWVAVEQIVIPRRWWMTEVGAGLAYQEQDSVD